LLNKLDSRNKEHHAKKSENHSMLKVASTSFRIIFFSLTAKRQEHIEV